MDEFDFLLEGNESQIDYEQLIKFYSEKSIEELMTIKPLWACAERINCLFDPIIFPESGKCKIVMVNTKELIEKCIFYNFEIEHLWHGSYDDRMACILDRWVNGLCVDPPIVSCQNANMLKILDGRHRVKLSYILGVERIPVAIYNSDISTISNIIEISIET